MVIWFSFFLNYQSSELNRQKISSNRIFHGVISFQIIAKINLRFNDKRTTCTGGSLYYFQRVWMYRLRYINNRIDIVDVFINYVRYNSILYKYNKFQYNIKSLYIAPIHSYSQKYASLSILIICIMYKKNTIKMLVLLIAAEIV